MTAWHSAARDAWAQWLASAGAREARVACGISLQAIATVLEVQRKAVERYERGERVPAGATGARYRRIIEGLRRHLEVPEEEEGNWDWFMYARPVTPGTLRLAARYHRHHHCPPGSGVLPRVIGDCATPACQDLVRDLRQQRAQAS